MFSLSKIGYWTIERAYFILLHILLASPGIKVKGWKGEKMKGGRQNNERQKASNAVHLSLYWDVLSCLFTIIEFSLDISFRVAMQPHLSPWKGEKKRGLLMPNRRKSITSCLFVTCLSSNAARLSPYKGEIEREFVDILLFYNCGVSHFSPFHLFTFPPL